MFTHLRVQNLKSVADSGPVELCPLTFLMGPNSSGKSTLLQAILVARQTVDSRDIKNPLAVEGYYAQLGSYREFIHRHERGRRLSLELGLSVEGRPHRLDAAVFRSLCITAEFSYNQKTFQIFPTTVSYVTRPQAYAVTKRRLTPRDSTVEVEADGGSAARFRMPSAAKFYDVGFLFRYPLQRRLLTKKADRRLLEVGLELPFALTQAFESQLKKTFYVGPLRPSAQRTYAAAGETPQDVGLTGESTFAVLWAARWNRPLREAVFQPANKWLKRFGIAAKLELKRIGGSYFTLLVTDPVLNVQCNFADVGFGASQLLPALVEILYAPRGSTIIMEQPEIHLHPAAQAVLGDLFLEAAGEGKQLIVETHSEHLVSRVLRRIAEGAMAPGLVALYYCEATERGTQVRRIPLDEFGRFGEGLPSGFFDQGYTESIAHVEAVAKRVGARPDGDQ
jgi:predicted ATPase